MTHDDEPGGALETLRSLKRRVSTLAASHLEALDLFHLGAGRGDGDGSGDACAPPGGPGGGSLADLRHSPVRVDGFASSVREERAPAGRQELVDPAPHASGRGRASLAGSARCVRSLLTCPDIGQGNADYGPLLERVRARFDAADLTSHGLAHLNPFTVGQLLPVLRHITGPDPGPLADLVAQGTDRLRRETGRDGVSMTLTGSEERHERRFPAHGYLTYWALLSLSTWDGLDGDASGPSLRWSETELYRQMALFTAGNDERSDAYQLGYNLLVQHRFNRDGLGDSLADLGLSTLFSSQLERGVWEKRNPLFRYGDRGEAYCFSFELLSTLLRQLHDEWELLVPHEDALTTALAWAERNAITGYGPPLWRSGLAMEEGRPESWATAEVYAFLQLFASYLTWRIGTIVLREFRGRPGVAPDLGAFEGLFQPEVRLPGEEPALLADLLRQRLLDDLRLPGEDVTFSLARHPRRHGQPRSGILFGPPGTGKTTYVKKVAEYLGWPLVVLDPSDFASEGLPLIATVAVDVFAKLLELEDTVIFFDEMEPLMQRRDGDGKSFEQQFLTTTFIPKLQELADRAASMFFVATNHYDSIDPAAKRPGRFDFRLQVLPPAYDEKLRMAGEELGDTFASIEHELRRESYRRHVTRATRSEMRRLIQDLRARPGEVDRLLTDFRAELADDDRIDKEATFNSFDLRP